jgi:tripartite-type tricarboxylate transporter receptor subunit TctC
MLRIVQSLLLLCGVLIAGPALAQNPAAYPERPIRLVVAFVPGGATDTMIRQITNDLQEALGQPVIVENRPGANGYIAWNYVASSEPDGYTLLVAENALGIRQALYKKSKSSFDPLLQYDAVAGLANAPVLLVLANNVKANNVAELIALSKTVPQKMNYASAGVGSVAHLTFEVFRDGAGIDAVHVPYKGGGQAINDVIGGQIDMLMAAVSVGKGLLEAGRVKAIAVTGSKRSPAMPNVPTIAETGVKTADVDLRFWFGLFGPKGIPAPVHAKIEKAVATVMSKPAVRARLANLDIEPEFLPGAALHKKLELEIANWTRFIDAKGIKAE